MRLVCEVPDVPACLTFASFQGVYDRPTSYQHWQLRDLVHCWDDDEVVYCCHESQLICYDVARNKATVLQELDYCPTSMACAYGFIAAGGDRSQLYVGRLADGQTLFQSSVGGPFLNNSLHFGKLPSGDVRLFICNNDTHIKMYDMRSTRMEAAGAIRCQVAMNYCSLSPDGVNLLAVGDNTDTLLYRGGHDFQRVACFHEMDDASLSCAWNATGTCFAAVSQSGRLVVWDHTSCKVIARFQTPRVRPCRSVKFSPAPTDLLAFCEDKDRVHLLDSRMYGTKQSLPVACGESEDQDISGISFAPSGRRLYAGTKQGLAAYHIHMHSRTAFPYADTV